MAGTSKRVTKGDENHPPKKRLKTSKTARNPSPSAILCDDVIDHIISFLPIHKAKQTTILSKRFEDSWLFSKHLQFDNMLSRRYTQMEFVDIVNRIITLHRGSTIESFHLCMNTHNYEYLISFWLELVVPKNPKVVHLDFSTGRSNAVPYVVPFDILDIESIETLKFSYCVLDLPPKFVGLHFLRTLVIRHMRIDSSIIQTIIDNCLLLECIDIAQCHKTLYLKIDAKDSKFLKVLKIGESNELDFLDINVPTLEVFHFVGNPKHIVFRNTMPKLSDVVIKLRLVSYVFPRQSMKMLLLMLSHVGTLTVTSTLLEDVCSTFIHGNMIVPQFYFWHVKELQLLMEPGSFCNPYDIVKFIDKCPHLERLFIDFQKFTFDEKSEYWNLLVGPKFVAYDKHFSYLKVVKFSNFKFNHLEMALAKFFLEKSPKMENLGIFTMKKYRLSKSSPVSVDFLQCLMSWRSSLSANVGVYECKDVEDSVFKPKHQVLVWY